MSDTVITARGLTKRYGETRRRRRASTSTFCKGETFGLLGPNGAGKTTTILMMLGLTEVSAGEVRVAGHDPVREPLAVKRRVGYLPDPVGFYDDMTAAENLVLYGAADGLCPRIAARRASPKRWRGCGSPTWPTSAVATFSRGMRQRLGLAELIMKRAEIAILDEPTSGLDPQSTHEFLDMIAGLKREDVTVLITSHLLDQVQRLCDRVALFQGGRILMHGHGAGTRAPGAGRRLRGRCRSRRRARQGTCGAARRHSGRDDGGAAPATTVYRLTADHDVRADAARAVVAADGALTRLSVDRAEPRRHLHPLLREARGRRKGDARCSVRARPGRASARWCSRNSPIISAARACRCSPWLMVLAAGGAALQRDRAACAPRPRKIRSCCSSCSIPSGQTLVVRRHPRLRHSADGDRARLRRHQRRA